MTFDSSMVVVGASVLLTVGGWFVPSETEEGPGGLAAAPVGAVGVGKGAAWLFFSRPNEKGMAASLV